MFHSCKNSVSASKSNRMNPQEQKTREVINAHRLRVFRLMSNLSQEVMRRGNEHDNSKFEPEEFPYYTAAIDDFNKHPFGTDGYNKAKESLGDAVRHHYAHNRHHPEYNRQNEEWRPVVGFEEHYEVSNYGNVRSVDRIISRSTQGDFVKKGQLLAQYVTPKGYCRTQLQAGDKCKNVMVHYLVAKMFIPNPKNKPTINHIDGCKTNNYVSNLEWATNSEQLIHAYDTGLREANIKYAVTCETLGITTIGIDKMAEELRKRGYKRARASGVWRCIHEPRGAKHLDLEFTATRFETWMNSPVKDMNLIDLLEMLCDWKAATQNHPENPGDLTKSIRILGEKYKISPQLAQIIYNTARDYGML